MVMNLIRWWRSLFSNKPKTPLRWSSQDFEAGKAWAKSQPHPRDNSKTLWDAIYSDRLDSEEILEKINQAINDSNKS